MVTTLDVSGLWPGRQPPDAPALDLTGKITRLDDHYSKAGGFSDVYRARYTSSDGVKEAAVKVFRFHFAVAEHEGRASKNTKMIHRELGIWKRLSHPNVVPFLGIVYDFERRGTTSLVSEWMPNGTLESFFSQYDDQLTLAHRLQLLLDIANGLYYLHSFPMVHGDLTCTNVLLDQNFNARLTDFGLTSVVGDIPDALRYLQMTTIRPGALRWAAPEHFSVNSNVVAERTTKSDIYSLGNLALLTLSGKHPWSEVPLDIAVILRLHQGDKPCRPTFRPIEDKHWEFIEYCWSPVNERPQAGDIVTCLKRFLDSCPCTQSLRNFFHIPSNSTIELSDVSPSIYAEPNTPKSVHFDDTYPNSPSRLRRASWHDGIPPSQFLPIPSAPEQNRRRSFGGDCRQLEPASPLAITPPIVQLHPLLNGMMLPVDFYFDLALPSFIPIRWVDPIHSVTISTDELRGPATYPPIRRMCISHDAIPEWPIYLDIPLDPNTPTPPPITLGDVLYKVHSSLHTQITHQDWAELDPSEETEIAFAYTRRCRSVPSSAREVVASQGVKRIDYLLKKHIFRGLIKAHDVDGFSHWRLITA